MKEKITYQEKYKPHVRNIKKANLPRLNHTTNGSIVKRAELRSAGICLLDGKEYEFQDLRIYLTFED